MQANFFLLNLTSFLDRGGRRPLSLCQSPLLRVLLIFVFKILAPSVVTFARKVDGCETELPSFPFLSFLLFEEPCLSHMEQNLIDAAFDGRVEVVESLLRDNPTINVNDVSSDLTALHWASQCGHAEVVCFWLVLPLMSIY